MVYMHPYVYCRESFTRDYIRAWIYRSYVSSDENNTKSAWGMLGITDSLHLLPSRPMGRQLQQHLIAIVSSQQSWTIVRLQHRTCRNGGNEAMVLIFSDTLRHTELNQRDEMKNTFAFLYLRSSLSGYLQLRPSTVLQSDAARSVGLYFLLQLTASMGSVVLGFTKLSTYFPSLVLPSQFDIFARFSS
jgi:hypothetical protein